MLQMNCLQQFLDWHRDAAEAQRIPCGYQFLLDGTRLLALMHQESTLSAAAIGYQQFAVFEKSEFRMDAAHRIIGQHDIAGECAADGVFALGVGHFSRGMFLKFLRGTWQLYPFRDK